MLSSIEGEVTNRLRELFWTVWGREAVLGMEPKALHMLTKISATKLHPQAFKGLVMSFPVLELQVESAVPLSIIFTPLSYQFIYCPAVRTPSSPL